MEFSSSQFDDQDVFHVSDLFSLHFCIFVGGLNFKKKALRREHKTNEKQGLH